MQTLLKSIRAEHGHTPKISSKIIFGPSIEEEVETFGLKNNIDLICIGTKGASGLKKVLMGSNAARIIENSSIPVLTIPEYARYKGVKNIVYPSDLSHLEEELEVIISFAKLMDARVHIVHIDQGNENNKNQENRLRKIFSYRKIDFIELKDLSVVHGINRCVANVDADLVTMFTNRTNLFKRLFRKSITKNTAFQTRTPLLTFQKD
jgi:nucleotide-binding universal stress UspA family protein